MCTTNDVCKLVILASGFVAIQFALTAPSHESLVCDNFQYKYHIIPDYQPITFAKQLIQI